MAQRVAEPALIVPTLRVGMPPVTLCVTYVRQEAERPRLHSHAERRNDHRLAVIPLSQRCGDPTSQLSR